MKRTLEEILHWIGVDKLSRTPNGFKGICHINENHIDSKPSMHIHAEKGFVKCFSCGAFKPLFTFLTDNNVPFDEAIDFMFTDFSHDRKELEGMAEWILGRKIPKSMLDRGFTIETLEHFGVGYDDVAGHITIPLRYNDILYGIQYRAYPKEFWTSDGFNKDNFIYNYEPTERRIYTEGFTDTWNIWQNGTKDVSAFMTNAPSDGQLELMKKHKEIWMATDNDMAGLRGAFKVHKELKHVCEIKMIPYKGKDAGGCSQPDWQRAMSSAVSFTEFEVEMINRNPALYEELTNPKKMVKPKDGN